MDGVLVVDKPAGPTSHDVVARVRRALGTRRIGHTGTLDPLATGVLPLVIGRATRLAALLSGAVKTYEADVRFGAATPTYDAEPRMGVDPDTGLARRLPPPPPPAGLTAEAIAAALSGFRGTFAQMPPPFSAKKTGGVPAYRRARRDEEVTLRPVRVSVDHLSLAGYEAGLARLELTCSAGFYVRSLAHELGEHLGCGAHLERLRRTRAGDFSVEDSVPLAQVEADPAAARGRIVRLDRLLPQLPAAVLTPGGLQRARHGNAVAPSDLASPAGPAGQGFCRLVDQAGALIAIAEPKAGVLHPVIVLV
ncbi:MAG TPA: tRNA pseudouridine(55) synthase TruB [Vicinamibacterales bacterium]|nr:tRNA pseudouridine(55) synthase TruB [Vicinamibacterales bacterium]